MKHLKTVLKGLPKVSGFYTNSGATAANQYFISYDNGIVFQSYNSTIVIKLRDGRILLDESTWNYSNTTAKYRRIFLDEGVDETRSKIESGVYKLVDLN